MTDKPFDSLLKETVTAPRLSGSKITTLTAQFVSALDVSYITTFFKLNRSLPAGGQARISSLYVFDALSRAAHKEATKGKRKADAKRCLDGLEAVVDSWVEGMITSDSGPWAEGQEKARKIIEIWRKTETFPSDTTERLSRRLVSSTPVASGSTTPPYEPGAPPPISPALPPLDPKGPVPEMAASTPNGEGPSTSKSPPSSALPPDILKLLGATSTNGASSSNTQATKPGSAELAAILAKLPSAKPQSPAGTGTGSPAAPNPLAALNFGQLAELAKVAQTIKSPPAVHQSLPPFPPQGYAPQPPGPPYAPHAPYNGGSNAPQPNSQGQGYDREETSMPPGTSRNYGRVKPLKNPQVGIREPEGRAPPPSIEEGYARPFGRRESEDRPARERERERSRSPVRREGDGGWGARGRGGGGGRGHGRGGYANHDESRNSNATANAAVPARSGGSFSAPAPGPTLETFDMGSFNPMDPGSWAILGEAWKRSRGSEPNQMELMAWMQEKMMGGGGGHGMGMGTGMGMNGGGGMGMGMNGGGGMGMSMGQGQGQGQGGGGGWGQQGGWPGQGGGY